MESYPEQGPIHLHASPLSEAFFQRLFDAAPTEKALKSIASGSTR
jgi:hypothetical protein